MINVLLFLAKAAGTETLLKLAFYSLDQLAKKTDNKIDDEIADAVKFVLIDNLKEKKGIRNAKACNK